MINYIEIKNQVYNRMAATDFYGYDPSAIRFDRKVLSIRRFSNKIRPLFLGKILRSILYRAIDYGGHHVVKIIKPEKKVYSKGLALTLSGLSVDYKKNESTIRILIQKIMDKKIRGKFLWAHDLDYLFPGEVAVTKNTPNIVTTYFVADAFWRLWVESKEEEWKNVFLNIVYDTVANIPFKEINENMICFMYTPITTYYVHNANMLYAELLSKLIVLEPHFKSRYLPLIKKAINYTIHHFDVTKSMPYAGPPTENLNFDNYHTGYVLRCLNQINNCLEEEFIEFNLMARLEKYFTFYYKNFISRFIVKRKKGEIESHSLAEAILVYCDFFHNLTIEESGYYEKAIENTIMLLWHAKEGYFFNKIRLFFNIKLFDKTEMVRWSNSWMFFALSIFEKKYSEINYYKNE